MIFVEHNAQMDQIIYKIQHNVMKHNVMIIIGFQK